MGGTLGPFVQKGGGDGWTLSLRGQEKKKGGGVSGAFEKCFEVFGMREFGFWAFWH
jgi:hypothetical protein